MKRRALFARPWAETEFTTASKARVQAVLEVAAEAEAAAEAAAVAGPRITGHNIHQCVCQSSFLELNT
jgi:cytochrome c5